jgi:hypothetical protein
MIWHATGDQAYSSGEYSVYQVIHGWRAWIRGEKNLGEANTFKEAMRLCELDQDRRLHDQASA